MKEPPSLYSPIALQRITRDMAGEIGASWLVDDIPFMVVTLLQGAVPFSKLLVGWLESMGHHPIGCVNVKATSYKGTKSTGRVFIETSPLHLFALEKALSDGTRILVLDDILESGLTLNAIYDRFFSNLAVDRIRFGVLVSKRKIGPENRVLYNTRHTFGIPTHVGMDVDPSTFLVGFGMDYDGRYRDLPYLGYLPKDMQ